MRIYLLQRRDGSVNCDEYDAFVVLAPDEDTARFIATDHGDEGGVWDDPKRVFCDYIGDMKAGNTLPQVVLGSFNAG